MLFRSLLSAIAITGLTASSAQAYARQQTNDKQHYLYWPSQVMPIQWSVETSPPGGAPNRAAVIDAFEQWTATSCATVSLDAPGSLAASGKAAQADGASRVFFQPDWDMGSAVLGLTSTTFNTNGAIAEADVEFNVRDWDWMAPGDYETCRANQTGCVDTVSVALHEAGHFFGLAHTPVQDAVMFATWSGPPKRGLANDDIQGICAIYPKGSGGTGMQGSACLKNDDCTSGLICAAKQGSTSTICTRTCTGTSDATCPGRTTCQRTNTGFACLPSLGGTQGAPCGMEAPCEYGYWCLGTNGVFTCRQDCDPQDADCPGSLRCQTWASAGIPNPPPQNETLGGFCATGLGPVLKKQCEMCEVTSDCQSGLTCVPFEDGSSGGVCRNTCSADNQCGDVPRCLPRDTFQTASSVCACTDDLGTFGAPCRAQNKCDPDLVCVNDGTSTDTLCRIACGDSLPECPDGQYCKQFGSVNACVKGAAPKPDAGPDDGSGGDALPCGCASTSPLAGILSMLSVLAVSVRRRSRR